VEDTLETVIDRCVASQALGDRDAVASLAALCATLAARACRCWLVFRDESRATIGSEEERDLGADLARAASGRRALFRAGDAAGTTLASGRWAAVEPAASRDGNASADLCVVGEGDLHEVLVALPRAARAAGSLVAVADLDDAIAEAIHAANNHLASIVANVELASLVLQTPEAERNADDEQTLASAVDASKASAKALKNELPRIFSRARGHG